MKIRTLFAWTAVAAIAAWPTSLVSAGVTGNSYNVTSFTDAGFGDGGGGGGEPVLLTGCANFFDTQEFQLDLSGETPDGTINITVNINPYSEVDLLFFGFWFYGPFEPPVAGGEPNVQFGGLHLLFGSLIFSAEDFSFSGIIGECVPPTLDQSMPIVDHTEPFGMWCSRSL